MFDNIRVEDEDEGDDGDEVWDEYAGGSDREDEEMLFKTSQSLKKGRKEAIGGSGASQRKTRSQG